MKIKEFLESKREKEIKKRIGAITRKKNGDLTSSGWVAYYTFLTHAEDDIKYLLSRTKKLGGK